MPKKRRAKGDGTLYRKRNIWWIAYRHPDGTRKQESTGSTRREAALQLLRKRIGAVEHNLPVIPRAEQLTFHEAAQAVKDDFAVNEKRSAAVVNRRIDKHLTPYFGGRRLIGITTADVNAYIAHRKEQGIQRQQDVVEGDATERRPIRVGDVSNAEINRELQILKRMFSLAISSGRIAAKPKISMLQEASARAGFFEREQYESVLAHLPDEIRPVITFAYITGWRIASEVLPMEWRQVDFDAREVRLDPGTTKNGEGRIFPMTAELRQLLQSQHEAHTRLKKEGLIEPWVFWRMVAEGRGRAKKPQPIVRFDKVWKAACRAAGCPGRIPHDLRRTAVRNLVRAGIAERVAMMMTGHKTRSVFERYNITSPGDLLDAARKLDGAASRPTQRAESGRPV